MILLHIKTFNNAVNNIIDDCTIREIDLFLVDQMLVKEYYTELTQNIIKLFI